MAKYLSIKDEALLKEIIEKVQRLEENVSSSDSERMFAEPEEHQVTQVYIANTPSGGIPVLTDDVGGTGTGTGPAKAGSAPCNIYKVTTVGSDPTLTQVAGLSKTVYNLSTQAIAKDIYIPVIKTKFGKWIAGFTVSTDIFVKVDATDTADFLDQQFTNYGIVYSAIEDAEIAHRTEAGTGGVQVKDFVNADALNEWRVTDNRLWGWQSGALTVHTLETWLTKLSGHIAGNQQFIHHAPAEDPTWVDSVPCDDEPFGGGGQVTSTLDGLLTKVSANDTAADNLEGQFADHGAAGYTAATDIAIPLETVSPGGAETLRAYLELGAGLGKTGTEVRVNLEEHWISPSDAPDGYTSIPTSETVMSSGDLTNLQTLFDAYLGAIYLPGPYILPDVLKIKQDEGFRISGAGVSRRYASGASTRGTQAGFGWGVTGTGSNTGPVLALYGTGAILDGFNIWGMPSKGSAIQATTGLEIYRPTSALGTGKVTITHLLIEQCDHGIRAVGTANCDNIVINYLHTHDCDNCITLDNVQSMMWSITHLKPNGANNNIFNIIAGGQIHVANIDLTFSGCTVINYQSSGGGANVDNFYIDHLHLDGNADNTVLINDDATNATTRYKFVNMHIGTGATGGSLNIDRTGHAGSASLDMLLCSPGGQLDDSIIIKGGTSGGDQRASFSAIACDRKASTMLDTVNSDKVDYRSRNINRPGHATDAFHDDEDASVG